MSEERLSEEAAARLLDRVLLAEAEVKSLRKALKASEARAESEGKKAKDAADGAASTALSFCETMSESLVHEYDWNHYDLNRVCGSQSARVEAVRKKAAAILKKIRGVNETQAKWHNVGAIDGMVMAACYLSEVTQGRRSEEDFNRVQSVIATQSPETLPRAAQARAALVKLADMWDQKTRKTKKK